MKLRDLFENRIVDEEDYYVININNERVVDNRSTIDLRYRDYLNYNVVRLYVRETSKKSYLVIRIEN